MLRILFSGIRRPGLSLIFARPRPRAPVPTLPSRLPTIRSHCARARCSAAGSPGSPVGAPHLAAGPPDSRRRAWRLATAVRGFASRPRPRHGARTAEAARYPYRAAITHAHYSSGAMGTSRPTAVTPAKHAPPLPRPALLLSRVAPAPTGATCEKERTSTRMPARSFFGNHARSITNGECRLLCTMPHDTPRRPQAVCAQHHPSSPQAPQPWQPSAEACRQRALE